MKIRKILLSSLQIRTHIHFTWYLVFLLFTGIITSLLPESYPLWQRILFGMTGTLAFFLVANFRQFFINLFAISVHVPVKNATLYFFGGETRVVKADTKPGREFVVALSSLILNFLIAILFQWLSINQSIFQNIIVFTIVQWLAFIWYALALVNIIPGFPLDGGKILMVFLWKVTGNYLKAVRISARLGRSIGVISIAGGITILIMQRELINSFLLILFGWALVVSAAWSYRRALLLENLYHTTALNIMTVEYPPISPQTTIKQIVYEFALVTGQHYFAVVDNAILKGVVTIDSIRHVRKNEWDSTTAANIMKPFNKIKTIRAEDSAAHVMELIDQTEIDQVPVVTEDKLNGVAIKDDLLRLADIYSRLKL